MSNQESRIPTTDMQSVVNEYWSKLEDKCERLQATVISLEQSLVLAQHDSAHWQDRCLEAERKRDFYMRHATSINTSLTRLAESILNFSELFEKGAGDLAESVAGIINNAKNAAYAPSGAAPVQGPELTPQEQEKLQALVEKLAPKIGSTSEG